MTKIDETDRRILNLLQVDADLSLEQVAQRVSLRPTVSGAGSGGLRRRASSCAGSR